jgi:hypothetical protein
MRLILSLFVVLAWSSGPFFGSQAPTLSGPLTPVPAVDTRAVAVETPSVDFDHLHILARDALNQLRQSQASRPVTVASAN